MQKAQYYKYGKENIDYLSKETIGYYDGKTVTTLRNSKKIKIARDFEQQED